MKTTYLASAALSLFVACVSFTPALHAAPKTKVLPLNKTTVAVTDFTEIGSLLPVPTPEAPVYYTGVNAGLKAYTSVVMGGDPPPSEQTMLKVIVQVLAEQGYLAATPDHPATQVIACSWGTIGSTGKSLLGPGPGLQFLGGDKLGLIEPMSLGGQVSADVLRRGFRSGIAVTVAEMAHDYLYAVLVRSYDMKAANEGRIVQLWETRIACSAPGGGLAESLPRLVVSGRRAMGRETPRPMVENVARKREAVFEYPELQVIEFIEPQDLARAREEQAKNPPTPTRK